MVAAMAGKSALYSWLISERVPSAVIALWVDTEECQSVSDLAGAYRSEDDVQSALAKEGFDAADVVRAACDAWTLAHAITWPDPAGVSDVVRRGGVVPRPTKLGAGDQPPHRPIPLGTPLAAPLA